jgi:ParB-like chromosome segregation protein Spo0J
MVARNPCSKPPPAGVYSEVQRGSFRVQLPNHTEHSAACPSGAGCLTEVKALADTTRATLPIDRIVVDPSIQIRRSNHEQTIERYMAAFEKLPPVDVFDTGKDNGHSRYLLGDGFHRVASAQRLGRTDIEANIHMGSREDAAEFAVVANTKNADPLSPEERDEGVRRLRQLHPDWATRQLADVMSVSQVTVSRVFQIDEVKRATIGTARDSRESLTNSHYREIAPAPREAWQPLVKAAADRGWTRDVTAQAVRNLKDDRVPDERKQAILDGEADPVVVTPDGQFAVHVDVVGRQLREMQANDAVLALERALEQLAKLRLYRPEAIIDTAGGPRIDRLIEELPGYVSFLEELLTVAKRDRGKVSVVK